MNVSVISWFKDNKRLKADSDDRITVFSTNVSVKGLMANDSGLYTCLAQGSRGQNLNGSLFITIKSKSVITSIKLTLCLRVSPLDCLIALDFKHVITST